MAKFCVYCGRPLKDGEVCNCRSSQNSGRIPEENNLQQNEIVQIGVSEKQPEKEADIAPAVSYFKNIWKLITAALKTPATVLSSFTNSGDIKTAFGLISIYSIINSLFVITIFAHMNSAISGFVKGLPYVGSYFSQTQLESSISFPLGKIFFVSLITEFGLLCLFAAILLLVSKAFFNVSTSYGNTLCVSASGAVAAMPLLIIAILCGLLNVKLGLFIALLSGLLKIFFMFSAFDGISLNRNKGVYIVFISVAVLAICSYIVMRLTFLAYMPDGFNNLSSTLNQAKSSFSNGDVSGLFG